MILRLFVEHFTAISIDMVATIGVFAYLAFSFLPEWEETPETEWWDTTSCVDFWDFQVTWMQTVTVEMYGMNRVHGRLYRGASPSTVCQGLSSLAQLCS